MDSFIKPRLLVIIFLMFLSLMTVAQKKDLTYYQCAFFSGYKAGSMASWPGLIDEMEAAKSIDVAWQTEMVKALYGLVGFHLGAGNKDMAKLYVNRADVYLPDLLEANPNNAQLHSLAGAFYAYKMALAFYKAPFLGPKCLYHIGKAIELDPNEPMGYIEKGNSLLFRPAILGGDKKEALALYRKAMKLMESGNNLKCSWQYLSVRAFILIGLFETNQNAEAKIFMQEIEKDYGSIDWIKQFVGVDWFGGKK